MRYLRHHIHIYQRPKRGSGFLNRYTIYNYQHSICNQGWFDTASGDIAVKSDSEGQYILENYLGCFVAIYVDNAVLPIWEGFINRITFNSGGIAYTISLDEMANRVSVIYTGAANVMTQTAVVNNTTSQAIYGIKQTQLDLGANPSASTQPTVLRDTILAQQAYPQRAIGQAQGNANIVHFELLGMYHTLEWTKYFTGLTAATSQFGTDTAGIIGVDPNGATFYDNTNTTKVSANTATVAQQDRGSSFWEHLLKTAEAGDGSNYWICGILPTNPNTGKRLFYYRQANLTVEYTALKANMLKPRSVFGKPVAPYLVVPDRAIRVTDALLPFNGSLQIDPTVVYIQKVDYDANSQTVRWFGADDTTARAAFRLNQGFLPVGVDFGAVPRQIVT